MPVTGFICGVVPFQFIALVLLQAGFLPPGRLCMRKVENGGTMMSSTWCDIVCVCGCVCVCVCLHVCVCVHVCVTCWRRIVGEALRAVR